GHPAGQRQVLHGAGRAARWASARADAGHVRRAEGAHPGGPEKRRARVRRGVEQMRVKGGARMIYRLHDQFRRGFAIAIVVSLFGAASGSDGMAATEITLWTMRTGQAHMGNLRADVVAFEQQNPTIKVTIEAVPYNVVYPKLAAAIQAGTPPNLFNNIEAMVAFMHAKQTLEPIDDVIDGLGRDQFTKKYLDWVTAGGKTWAIPDWALHQAVYYRKDLLAQKKLSVPKSWGELLDVAKALN